MKVLLFSHKNDIDGMGSVVLAKLAFFNLEYILCETYELQNEINRLYTENRIYDYDMIYITDMWLEDPTLTKIANDSKLNGKFFIFDHHKSAIEEKYDRFDFTKIILNDDKGRCCGTSLFYDYLVENNFLTKAKGIYQFVELTRKYDTWEWKTRYNDEEANDLNILFSIIGKENYIDIIHERLSSNPEHFDLTAEEIQSINYKKAKITEKLEHYVKNIFYKEIDNDKVGIVFIESEYQNDLAQYLRDYNYNMDYVILISLEDSNMAIRNISFNVSVLQVAEKLNGKGHDNSASCLITKKEQEQIIDLLLEKLHKKDK